MMPGIRFDPLEELSCPAIQAAIFLAQHKPREAVGTLSAATEFEEITPDIWFLRGQALLADNQPARIVLHQSPAVISMR
jgi:hypothetical protein